MSNHQHEPTTGPPLIIGVPSRRLFLTHAISLVSLSAATALGPNALASGAVAAPTQPNWRRCGKCSGLFFNGYGNKGRCPATGAHATLNQMEYVLTYDDSTGPGQGDWRFCSKCKALFFNGYPTRGACPVDGNGHMAAGYNFFLAHDRRPSVAEDVAWNFCDKCYVLFSSNGRAPTLCAAGQNHHPAGYKFLLRLAGVSTY